MKHYNVTIDYIRVVLIVMVIIVHIVNFGELYPNIKSSILAFFMPAFLIITGYLVNINKSVKEFCLYLVRIILPYIIMVSGFMILSLYLPVRDGVDSITPYTVYKVMCVTSIGPYWFLHVMIVCGLLYYVSFKVPAKKDDVTKSVIFAVLLILTSLYTPYLGLRSAAYYFTGVMIRLFVKDISKVIKANFWTIIPFLLLLTDKTLQDWGSLSIFACCFFFFSFTAWCSQYFKGRFASVMQYIGRNTLPIYIFHPIFTMAAKYMLPLFTFDSTGLCHTVVTILMGLGGSILIARAMDMCGVSHIFGKKKILR